MTEPDHGGGLSTRHIRIAAIAGGAVLIVGLAVAIGTAGGSRPPAHQTATPAPSTSSPPAPPAASPPPASSPPVSAPPTSSAPVVRWHGTLTVSGPDAHRDLDSVPPRTFPQDADLNGDWLTTELKADSDGVQFALSRTPSPGFTTCRDAVATNGVDDLERVRDGDLLCLITSQGRIARLRTLTATQTSTDPILKFDVTVWDPPTR